MLIEQYRRLLEPDSSPILIELEDGRLLKKNWQEQSLKAHLDAGQYVRTLSILAGV